MVVTNPLPCMATPAEGLLLKTAWELGAETLKQWCESWVKVIPRGDHKHSFSVILEGMPEGPCQTECFEALIAAGASRSVCVWEPAAATAFVRLVSARQGRLRDFYCIATTRASQGIVQEALDEEDRWTAARETWIATCASAANENRQL